MLRLPGDCSAAIYAAEPADLSAKANSGHCGNWVLTLSEYRRGPRRISCPWHSRFVLENSRTNSEQRLFELWQVQFDHRPHFLVVDAEIIGAMMLRSPRILIQSTSG